MTTTTWLAAITGMFFVFCINSLLYLHRIQVAIDSIEHRAYMPINVTLLNGGLDITNHPEMKWSAEHP